jgi:hypothetical protein
VLSRIRGLGTYGSVDLPSPESRDKVISQLRANGKTYSFNKYIKKKQLRVNKQLHMASYLNPLSHIKGNWLNAVAFVALRKIQDGLLRRA